MIAMDLLIGLEITRAKENSLLRPTDGAMVNLISELAVGQGYVRNKVDLVPLACEDEIQITCPVWRLFQLSRVGRKLLRN